MNKLAGAWARRLLLVPLDFFREILLPRYSLYLSFFRLTPVGVVAWLGRVRAVRAVEDAVARVPAYRAFLSSYPPAAINITSLQLPPTDKDNYIRMFTTEMRCVD